MEKDNSVTFELEKEQYESLYNANLSPLMIFSFVLAPFYGILIYNLHHIHSSAVGAAILLSILGYWMVVYMMPSFCKILRINASKAGSDLCKTPKMPDDPRSPAEPIGVFISIIYLTLAVYMQIFLIQDNVKMIEYNAGLFTICFISLLGYADDCLKLAWKYKIITPLIGCAPMILSYRGSTTLILPEFLADHLGISSFNMYYFYHILMLSSIVFYCNAINIYAGVNGLEVGQSIILSFFTIVYNTIEIISIGNTIKEYPSLDRNTILYQNLLSLFLSLPFFACSLSVLLFNWAPTKIFVGDSYTYFAGAHFAVTAIMGHSIRTFVLFSLPQIFNFVISLPQLYPPLFGFLGLSCPNHRLPHLDRKHDPYLQPSKLYNRIFNVDEDMSKLLLRQIENTHVYESDEHKTEWEARKIELSNITKKTQVYPIYFKKHSQEVYFVKATQSFEKVPVMLTPNEIKESRTNLTIICLVLKVFGKLKEQHLVAILLFLQFICGIFGLLIRYSPAYSIFLGYKI